MGARGILGISGQSAPLRHHAATLAANAKINGAQSRLPERHAGALTPTPAKGSPRMNRRFYALALMTASVLPLAAPALAGSGAETAEALCGACHPRTANGGMYRIESVRKTPEAWQMTIQRMVRNYRIGGSPEELQQIAAWLSDTRGLTVAETEGYRYILEREPVATDEGPTPLMSETCARCHSYARVALQRRTPDDWAKLVHFHLGQFPTLEYQALARDRDWWAIAQNEVIPYLAANYPLGDDAAPYAGDPAGNYAVAGRQPGRGDYHGTMTVSGSREAMQVTLALTFADGEESYSGQAVIHGAGEWRGTLTGPAGEIRQILAMDANGRLDGRWHRVDSDVIGGRMAAVRQDHPAVVLAAQPAQLTPGTATEVRLTGTGLTGDVTATEGATVETLGADANGVTLRITAANAGPVGLTVAGQEVSLTAYDRLDRVSVVPERTISRIGDGGGPIPKVPAQFEAMGWLNGPDGQPATDDDIAVGAVPATWHVEPMTEEAARMKDVDFAGQIDASGLLTPADAGPNPDRPMTANNVGDLKVVATVANGDQPLTASAHLFATVQRFVDAPIR